MRLLDFCAKYRLTALRVEDGDEAVTGKTGQISLYGAAGTTYEVWYCPDLEGDATDEAFGNYCRTWGRLKASFRDLGMEISQDATGEGAALFDPEDPLQAKAAIRAADLRRKKRVNVTPALLERLERARAVRASRRQQDD